MAEIRTTAVSLSFCGHDLDPEEISRAFGRPTRAARKGEIVLTPAGREQISYTGIWLLKAEDAYSGEIDSQVAALFAPLTQDLGIWRDLAARHQGRVFVGLFLSSGNDGIGIQPQTLAAIGTRGLVLDLDIYSGTDFEEPQA
jgi:hypothetical protein